MKQTVSFPKIAAGVCLIATLLANGGCGSGPVPRDLMMEEALKQPVERPVAMRGEGKLLDGKVGVLATVSRGFDRGRRGTGRGGRPEDNVFDDGRRRRRDEENAFAEVYNIGYGDSEEEQKEAMAEYIRIARARRAAGSPMPPVTLRVAFQNHGTEPIELEVTEVNSELGNFAVRPPKLTIAPGETGVLEPMVSQLGVTSDEIPLKVAIRTGRQKEQQVVVVKNIIGDSLRKEFEALQKK